MKSSSIDYSANATNESNIFIPVGTIVPKSDWATLKFNLNISTLFDETRNLCKVAHIIPQFIKQRASKVSKPNKHILSVLKKNLLNLCKEDVDAMDQINAAFGFKDLTVAIPNDLKENNREKRQIAVLSTMVITSLVTYFSTKELISMAQDDDDDELYDSTNNLITAVKNHESRITRLETKQAQLETHLDRLTKQMILGIQTEYTFFDMFGASTYANSLSRHIRDIQNGLFTLLTSNKLHPNLVSWGEAKEGISKLRKIAMKHGKELMLENDEDLFQLKSSFVAWKHGIVSILVHIPAITPSSKLRLYKFYGLPQRKGNAFEMRIENEDKYLAINSEATMFTTLPDLRQCTAMRDMYLCNKVNLLQKANSQSCLFNLFSKNGKSRESCTYKVLKIKSYGVRLSSNELYFSPEGNRSSIQIKCNNKENADFLEVTQPMIIKLREGCSISTHDFIFKVHKTIGTEEINSQTISVPNNALWELFHDTDLGKDVQNFLEDMKEKPISIRIPDLEQKFHLKTLHHKNKLATSVFSTTAIILLIAFLVLCFCIYKKNRPIYVRQYTRNDPIQSSITMSSLISTDAETQCDPKSIPCEPESSNSNLGAPKRKSKLNTSILAN